MSIMADSFQAFVAIAVGIGLAAATGFRVFLPLLVAGLAARWGALPLADGFGWLSYSWILAALGTASVLEVAAYYFPGIDHALDLLASPAALVAGVIVSASVMVDVPSSVMWPAAIIGGGGVAGATKVTSAVLRAKSGLFTAGLANPVVSTGETASALGVSVIAILAPLAGLVLLAVLLVWMVQRVRRLFQPAHP